jgi:hypothetical protein
MWDSISERSDTRGTQFSVVKLIEKANHKESEKILPVVIIGPGYFYYFSRSKWFAGMLNHADIIDWRRDIVNSGDDSIRECMRTRMAFNWKGI